MDIIQKFEFRNIRQEEAAQAVGIEQICFPPNEACSEQNMIDRIAAAPETFLVAVDKATGKIAGFLNGIATNENRFRDDFFTNAGLHEASGQNIMLLGLDVLPQYRRQGLARALVQQYLQREYRNGRHALFLTCLESKVSMYEKFGFHDLGMADSTWGGEAWHEMYYVLEESNMLFLCYPKCSTCQKAQKWLDAHQLAYTQRHITEDNPSYEELKAWYEKSKLPLKRFFNTSGLVYKEMQLKDKLPTLSEEEQLKLLATNGMLVKRPLVICEDKVLVGFKEKEWEALL